jgi:tetratricopeptide (TPR) repeat protein
LSTTDEPEIQTDKAAARPNFLGKLWKAQAPSSADLATPSSQAKATSSPPITPAQDSISTDTAPAGEIVDGDDDAKIVPPSKFLSKLWKAQKSSGDVNPNIVSSLEENTAPVTGSNIDSNLPARRLRRLNEAIDSTAAEDTTYGTTAGGEGGEEFASNKASAAESITTQAGSAAASNLSPDGSVMDGLIQNVEITENSQADFIPLKEIQESLELDEAALDGEHSKSNDFSETVEASELESTGHPAEHNDSAESIDSSAPERHVQKKELTPEERKAQRKAAVETYERMREEQRLKTKRGNTVRTLNSLNLAPSSPNSNSTSSPNSTNSLKVEKSPSLQTAKTAQHSSLFTDGTIGPNSEGNSAVDTEVKNENAISDSAKAESLVTRQSFASTVAATPANPPRAERAAGANEFVRKHPLLVVIGIGVIAASVAYYQTGNSRSNLREGETLLTNKQLAPAIKTFTRAIASNPRLVPAYIGRGEAYFQTGATDQALADCRKAIELDPGNPEAYEIRAKIVLPLGHFRQVISDLETVSRIRGVLAPAAMAVLGHAYMGDGQYSHALTQFSKKLDRDPDDLESLVAMGKCYLAMNLPNKAIENCDIAIAKAGSTYDAYVLRGECEDQLGNGTAALKDFEKAVSINGERADAFLSRGMYFARTGDFVKASHDMDSGLKLPGGVPAGRYKHAMVYALQNDKAKALEQFKLLEAKPDFQLDNWFYIQRSDVYAQLQDFKMAQADLEKALSDSKSYQTACWLRLARCFEFKHDYKKAAFYAGKVLTDEPTNSTALLKHSKYSLLCGNRMTAMDDLYKAIASAPKNPLSYVARGDIYVQDRQYSLAEDDYQRAAKLAPLNSEIKKKLIACNELLKRPKASVQSTADRSVTFSAAALKEIADGDLQTLKTKGYEALKSGRADYAVAALTRAIYLNPRDANARRYLAYALLKTGNTADAVQQFYAWEKIAEPDPSSSIAFAKSIAAQTDAQTLFEHLAERYRTNALILLEIARQCAYYHYDSVENSALDWATKVATSDEQVALNRLRMSLGKTSGK